MARVNIMLPDDLLERIDQVAQQEGVSRSKLLRLAFMAYCQQKEATYPVPAETGSYRTRHDAPRQPAQKRHCLGDPLKILRAERQAR